MFTKELIEFGLSEKEARAYLALLELEIAGVQEIAKAAGLNRSSAYVTLESLKRQGLVSISDEKNIRQYIATPPDALLRQAEDKAQFQQHLLKKIERVIPEMKALFKGTRKKPIIKVFEGKEGLINSFVETLNNSEKLMRVYSSPGNLNRIIGNYIPEYMQLRFNLGIKMLGMHPSDDLHKNLIKQGKDNFDEYVLIPTNKYKFPADIAIFDNKIGYMSGKDEGIAVIIESKEIADVMKEIFDLAFKEAKRLNHQLEK